jgi:hypothetical protein
VDVFLTIDTEIWCGGWEGLDEVFPDMFRKYVYGATRAGDYALPKTLEILAAAGLKASFFVEPLFSARFGPQYLAEITRIIIEAGQEIQLHLHPEWVDEATNPLLPVGTGKVGALSDLSQEQQATLVDWGLNALYDAGVERGSISAFRAGSYAANRDTLRALHGAGIGIDTSYNLACTLGTADISAQAFYQPRRIEQVHVYPVTVFRDGISPRPRHLQLSACSYCELQHMLFQAYHAGWESVVLVSHNFELLKPDKTEPDHIMVRRFRRLCRFLAENRDIFKVRGFNGLVPAAERAGITSLTSNPLRTSGRYIEQALRRVI